MANVGARETLGREALGMSSGQANAPLRARSRSRERSIVRPWVIACAAAELIGMGSGALLARAAAPDGGPSSALAVMGAGVATGLVEGVALGALQWRVLRTRFSGLEAGAWIGITVTAAVAGWTLASLGQVSSSQEGAEPSIILTLALAGVLGAGMGLLFGAAQSIVLRRHARDAPRWMVANTVGWAAAMPIIFLGASSPTAETSMTVVGVIGGLTGTIAGAVLGMITAWWLVRLRPVARESAMSETV